MNGKRGDEWYRESYNYDHIYYINITTDDNNYNVTTNDNNDIDNKSLFLQIQINNNEHLILPAWDIYEIILIFTINISVSNDNNDFGKNGSSKNKHAGFNKVLLFICYRSNKE